MAMIVLAVFAILVGATIRTVGPIAGKPGSAGTTRLAGYGFMGAGLLMAASNTLTVVSVGEVGVKHFLGSVDPVPLEPGGGPAHDLEDGPAFLLAAARGGSDHRLIVQDGCPNGEIPGFWAPLDKPEYQRQRRRGPYRAMNARALKEKARGFYFALADFFVLRSVALIKSINLASE